MIKLQTKAFSKGRFRVFFKVLKGFFFFFSSISICLFEHFSSLLVVGLLIHANFFLFAFFFGPALDYIHFLQLPPTNPPPILINVYVLIEQMPLIQRLRLSLSLSLLRLSFSCQLAEMFAIFQHPRRSALMIMKENVCDCCFPMPQWYFYYNLI